MLVYNARYSILLTFCLNSKAKYMSVVHQFYTDIIVIRQTKKEVRSGVKESHRVTFKTDRMRIKWLIFTDFPMFVVQRPASLIRLPLPPLMSMRKFVNGVIQKLIIS